MGKVLKKIAQVKLEKIMEEGNASEIARNLGITRRSLYDLKEGKYNLENISIGLCRSLKDDLKIDYEDWFEYQEE